MASAEGSLFDLMILGASGFTGKYVVREALKFLNAPSSSLGSLALAGRNPEKIAQALIWASNNSDTSKIPIFKVDIRDPSALSFLCCKTKLIANCIGPYRLYSEPVVAACAEAGIDYLDICGEPEFMEKMEIMYHEKASANGSLVISACGFDSVPAELGLMFNSMQWDGSSAPNHIDAYLCLNSDKKIVGNMGTFASAILGVANAEKLKEIRKSRPRRRRPLITGPHPRANILEKHKKLDLWAMKLPSADSVVVRRTLACLTENPDGLPGVKESQDYADNRKHFWSTVKPAHFGVKIGSKSLLAIFKYIWTGCFIGLFATFAYGRSLLFKFPEFFSLGVFRKTGPTEEEVNSATFTMWFVGRGYSDCSLAVRENKTPDREIITRISGPEIGYLTTPIILIQCALLVLKERMNLPKGGVYTPGIVFGPTNLREQLQENGISFDIVSKG